MRELQETLMDDDCYLPWHARAVPELSQKAALSASSGDPQPLSNGIDRSLGDADNGWWGGGALLAGYGFAWIGHFFFEHNRPATFSYPLYSFCGDFVMYRDLLTGRIPL